MASYKDYLEEAFNEELKALKKATEVKIDKETEEAIEKAFGKESEARTNLCNQISILTGNIDLCIEELKCAKDYFKTYDYLFILVCLRSAKDKLIDASDILNGWYPEDAENISADMIFTKDEEIDRRFS